MGIAVAAVLCLLVPASASATSGGTTCPTGQIRTASGCESFTAAGRHVRAIVADSMQEQDLRAALVRVDVGNRTLATASPGESMAGVPATLRMNFRIGSIAIPYEIDVLLQLVQQGKLSLDDPIGKWFPDLPNAGEVTLRMLASASSGYPDWVQENPTFEDELAANPFRQWKTSELLDAAFAQPLICDPGACFHYAHTGFVLIGKVLEKVTGQSLASLIHSRVFRPLGLRHTEISAFPSIASPVLHTYVGFRGAYEDATYWSPSWGISKSLLMNSTIGDTIRSAKALGTGALVSPQSQQQRIAPITVGLPIPNPAFSNDFYYGLGVLVSDSWLLQNPHENGFNSIAAYLPSRHIAVALSVTEGPTAANQPNRQSEILLKEISAYLSPDHVAFPAYSTPTA